MVEQRPSLGDIHLPGFGISHAPLVSRNMHILGFCDMYNPTVSEIDSGLVRSCGVMEGGFIGDMPTRACGDIYATGFARHAGACAGNMLTGVTMRVGHMETT